MLCILPTLSFFANADETYLPPTPTLEVATVMLDWHDAKRCTPSIPVGSTA